MVSESSGRRLPVSVSFLNEAGRNSIATDARSRSDSAFESADVLCPVDRTEIPRDPPWGQFDALAVRSAGSGRCWAWLLALMNLGLVLMRRMPCRVFNCDSRLD